MAASEKPGAIAPKISVILYFRFWLAFFEPCHGVRRARPSGRRQIIGGNMSVQSMTGYGKAEAIGEGYSVTVEFKSVNNRFLEFQIRTSKNILHLEPKLKQELGKHVTRGSVSCHISIR